MHDLILFLPSHDEDIIIPILHVTELRLRVVRSFAENHVAKSARTENISLSISKACAFTPVVECTLAHCSHDSCRHGSPTAKSQASKSGLIAPPPDLNVPKSQEPDLFPKTKLLGPNLNAIWALIFSQEL